MNAEVPDIFANAQTPDDTLPAGTSIKAYVETSNSAGEGTEVTNAVTPIASSGPNATMYGLRFESSRKTYLVGPDGLPSKSKCMG